MPPITLPAPSIDDTGVRRPENCMVGIIVPIIVKKRAAIWLRVNVDANRPTPVDTTLKISAASTSARKLPFTGTPNRVTARNDIRKKFSIPRATYGICLPSKNSVRVTGVTYRFRMEPSSFSRTTDRAVSIAGIIISSSGITAGTIAGKLLTSGL